MFKLKLNLMVFRDIFRDFRRANTPHRLRFLESITHGDGIVTFRFRSKQPIPYEAGQYGMWLLPKLMWGKPVRLFSLATAPGRRIVEITTRLTGSPYKRRLAAMRPGDTIVLLGPVGQFVLPEKIPSHLVMLAGGIGVTPYPALLKQLRRSKGEYHATMVYVARPGDFVYRDKLVDLADELHCIDREHLQTTLDAVRNPRALYYVSGPPGFVRDMLTYLRAQGIEHIRYDGFLGY